MKKKFNPDSKAALKVMNELLDNVQGMMPKVLDNTLPEMTGGTIPEYIQPKK